MKILPLLFMLGAMVTVGCSDRGSDAVVGGSPTPSEATAKPAAPVPAPGAGTPVAISTPRASATPTETATAVNDSGRVVVLGTPFRLAVGERVGLPQGGLLSLDAVVNDSRCATDVTCIWAGEATAVFTSTDAGGAVETWRVTVPPERGEATIGGLHLRVIDLRPQPVSTAPIDPGDYVVTAVIDSAGMR